MTPLRKIFLTFLALTVSGIACILTGIYYAVMCQQGCDYLSPPMIYPYISFWALLALSIYLLIKLLRLLLQRA